MSSWPEVEGVVRLGVLPRQGTPDGMKPSLCSSQQKNLLGQNAELMLEERTNDQVWNSKGLTC